MAQPDREPQAGESMDASGLLPMLLGLLQGQGGGAGASDSSAPGEPGSPSGEFDFSPGEFDFASGEFDFSSGEFDFSALGGLMSLFQAMGQEDDSVRLLHALKPLLSQGRQDRVDQAVKLLRLMNLLPILAESGLLSNLFSEK